MTHLQKITTLAKKIRKAKPALKWTDAIKQASKQIKPAAKKAVKKVGNVTLKKSNRFKGDDRYIIMNDGKPHLDGKPFFKETAKDIANSLKKVKAKRVATKKVSGTKTHKDTKSHNVNIRVVSGANALTMYKQLCDREAKLISMLKFVREQLPRIKKRTDAHLRVPEILQAKKIAERELKAVKQQKAIQKKWI